MKSILKIGVLFILILCNVGCDQITKNKVRKEIVANETIHIIKNNFILTHVENKGAAYGLGENLPPILKLLFLNALPLIFLIGLFVYSVKKEGTTKLNLIAVSFLIGGGLGNIYDRILFNSVTDFMYVELGFFNTAVFNMADVSVVVGTLLLILNYSVFDKNGVSKEICL